jgi:hypothetical protein
MAQLNMFDSVDANENDRSYGWAARTPKAQDLLRAGGFGLDGSGVGSDLGPEDWQIYTPQTPADVFPWVEAAIGLNDALNKAVELVERGHDIETAFWDAFNPVMEKHAKTGAGDTEPRNVGMDALEARTGLSFGW